MELTSTKYKQTEVGLIPEDWGIVIFSEIADKSVKNSITGGPFGSNLKTDDYTNDGVQIIQLQNIGDGKFIDNSIVYTSYNKADELKSCNIYPGEIILSKMGDPVARACIMPQKAKRYLMASDGIRLVVDENKFSKLFVFHYINSKYFRNRAIDISTGSTRQRIGLPDLKSLFFIKPPLTEQKAIATALSDVDSLISSLDKLIIKKKAIKQGAMQELLTPPHQGGRRLPGFNGDWTYEPIIDFASITTGASDTQDRIEDGIYPFFVRSQKVEKINKFSFDGEAILTSGDGVGVGKIFHYINGKFDFHQRVYCIHGFRENVDGKYFFNQFSNHFFDRVMSMTAKSSVDSVRREMIANMKIYLPPTKKEQTTITQILSDMDLEIESLENKKAKYQEIKQGMMQELLTGKTRLFWN